MTMIRTNVWLREKQSEKKNNLKIRNAIAPINMGIFSPQISKRDLVNSASKYKENMTINVASIPMSFFLFFFFLLL